MEHKNVVQRWREVKLNVAEQLQRLSKGWADICEDIKNNCGQQLDELVLHYDDTLQWGLRVSKLGKFTYVTRPYGGCLSVEELQRLRHVDRFSLKEMENIYLQLSELTVSELRVRAEKLLDF